MTTRRELDARWQAIAAELAGISSHRIVPERLGMTDREIALLAEQDEIEFTLGMMDADARAAGGKVRRRGDVS